MNGQWDGSDWHFHDGQRQAAIRLVERYHYSGRFAGNVVVGTAHLDGGLFGDYGEAIAACCFGIPPARWSEEVLELQRLVLHPQFAGFPLTALISKTVKLIRQSTHYDLLVSFADWTQDHHGGIYQASSWNYHEKRKPKVDQIEINGQMVPRRSVNSRYGTSKLQELERIVGGEIVPHYDKGKHLYWRAIRKSGKHKASRLGLESNPYPKPNMGQHPTKEAS